MMSRAQTPDDVTDDRRGGHVNLGADLSGSSSDSSEELSESILFPSTVGPVGRAARISASSPYEDEGRDDQGDLLILADVLTRALAPASEARSDSFVSAASTATTTAASTFDRYSRSTPLPLPLAAGVSSGDPQVSPIARDSIPRAVFPAANPFDGCHSRPWQTAARSGGVSGNPFLDASSGTSHSTNPFLSGCATHVRPPTSAWGRWPNAFSSLAVSLPVFGSYCNSPAPFRSLNTPNYTLSELPSFHASPERTPTPEFHSRTPTPSGPRSSPPRSFLRAPPPSQRPPQPPLSSTNPFLADIRRSRSGSTSGFAAAFPSPPASAGGSGSSNGRNPSSSNWRPGRDFQGSIVIVCTEANLFF